MPIALVGKDLSFLDDCRQEGVKSCNFYGRFGFNM